MSFDDLMNDTITLIKKDGKRFENIKASVQRDKVFTNDANMPIEDGDFFERKLPGCVVERYEILDAGYMSGVAGIESHFQSVVRKATKIEPRRQSSQIVYNLIGANARVNIHSFDNSTNLVGIEPKELFNKLREALQQSVLEKELLGRLQEKVNELEKTRGTNNFSKEYQDFIALAANYMTILGPFIPALSQMLSFS